MMRHIGLLSSLGVLGLALFSSGCSTFNHDWKVAAQNAQPVHDITGAWDGSWLSDVNGHHGRLRSLMAANGPADYTARFKARFWKIFTAGYTVRLQARHETNQPWQLEGEENLGKLAGGWYHYSAVATPEMFRSTYSNKYDHGTFELKRPKS